MPSNEDPNALDYFRRRKRLKPAASRIFLRPRSADGSPSIKIHRSGTGLFAGQHLLFFSDKSLLSVKVRKKLTQKGATIIGPIDNASQALRIIETRIVDAVIIDSSLEVNEVMTIVEVLYQIPLPFIFVGSPRSEGSTVDLSAFVLDELDANLSIMAEALFSRETNS